MDVVYVLGSGSLWRDRELHYSMLSLQKFGRGVDRVFVIGNNPRSQMPISFTQVPAEDLHCCKETNIMRKLRKACQHPEISEEFLFCNDDHFFLQQFHAQNYPFYVEGTLSDRLARRAHVDAYARAMENTRAALQSVNRPEVYYDVHAPMRIRKSSFLDAMNLFDWDSRHGFVVKSLYGNYWGLQGVPFEDCKIDEPLSNSEIRTRLAGRPVFSIGNRGLNGAMEDVLADFYK